MSIFLDELESVTPAPSRHFAHNGLICLCHRDTNDNQHDKKCMFHENRVKFE